MISVLLSFLANLFCAFCLFWMACKDYPKWKTYRLAEAILARGDNVLITLVYASAFLGNALFILFL